MNICKRGFLFVFVFVLTVFVRLFVFFLFTFCFVVFVFWGTPSHLRNLDFLPRQAFFFGIADFKKSRKGLRTAENGMRLPSPVYEACFFLEKSILH